MKKRNIQVSFALFIICSFLCVFFWKQFQLFEMSSTSMEPTIIGDGIPPTHSGNLVLIYKRINHPLKRNDLVLVVLDTKSWVETIRRIALIPGDDLTNSESAKVFGKVPVGFYYVIGDSTNAIDSRQVGLIKYNQVFGKVVWIIPNSFDNLHKK